MRSAAASASSPRATAASAVSTVGDAAVTVTDSAQRARLAPGAAGGEAIGGAAPRRREAGDTARHTALCRSGRPVAICELRLFEAEVGGIVELARPPRHAVLPHRHDARRLVSLTCGLRHTLLVAVAGGTRPAVPARSTGGVTSCWRYCSSVSSTSSDVPGVTIEKRCPSRTRSSWFASGSTPSVARRCCAHSCSTRPVAFDDRGRCNAIVRVSSGGWPGKP